MVLSRWLLLTITLVPVCGLHAATLTLASDGKSDYRIVIPDQASPCIRYAANELQTFFKQSTGANIRIVTENAAEGGKAFFLGATKRSLKVISASELKQLSADGVVIRTAGNDVFLRGSNDRGEIYSVEVFLEKYLGVRFLAIDCTIVPKHPTLTIDDIDYSYAPPFFYREYLSAEILYPPVQAEGRNICVRQRLNGLCDGSNWRTDEVGGRVAFYPFA